MTKPCSVTTVPPRPLPRFRKERLRSRSGTNQNSRELAAAQGAFLQLSGHTHGGQIRVPGVGPVGLPIHGKRYVMGLNQVNDMLIYTARGVGVYRPPMRFNCPPEVTLITLVDPETVFLILTQ